ncbi:MAG: 2-C-methyl-D-erythritol 4-phosphate cytidylyltransferase [Desulfobacteraceae bacterium]|nr:2-C-methyl-D-erythritol 4-phosphate cytidylyltransferase [Desulfobacteraceae bacterium]
MNPSENYVIIVAAGKGLRMESKTKKQYLDLNGIPILARTIMAFDICDKIGEIVLVIPEEDDGYCKEHVIDPFEFKKTIHLVKGGSQRQISVMNGLKQINKIVNSKKEIIVMIHDGVRPFIDQSIVQACIQKAIEHGACIPGEPISDTVKHVNPDLTIKKTVNREFLYRAQTPQTFKLDLIMKAYEHAGQTSFWGTDEASLVEHLGGKVHVIQGSKRNIKITNPDDLVLGKYLLEKLK